jgi:uncharacterized membrane protein YraQ (UPF0718 family)
MSKPDHNPLDLTARATLLEWRQPLIQPFAALAMILTIAFLVAFAAQGPDVVKARHVELVDLKGQSQAALAADTTGVIVMLLDKNGHVTASLRVNDDPRLTVRDAAGREVAALGAPRVQHLVR